MTKTKIDENAPGLDELRAACVPIDHVQEIQAAPWLYNAVVELRRQRGELAEALRKLYVASYPALRCQFTLGEKMSNKELNDFEVARIEAQNALANLDKGSRVEKPTRG